jgi:peptidoglycan/LPS O-acetylase OafA/YrhL
VAVSASEMTAPIPKIIASEGRSHTQRRDIQGLRALAVGLVVVYHLRPGRLPGGFVGVDVFFVISGFLIIGTLTGEIRRTGTTRLLGFYARRIRRLLPAACAVLLTTSAATTALVPMSRWPSIFREVVTSALNVQNWALAALSTDYTEATANASPVQHFWSLSVEEQFYLAIPLILLISAAWAARRGANPIRYAFIAVALVTLISFAYSVLYTSTHHGAAYFVTPTRMWELGLGGLAAMSIHRLKPNRPVRLLLGWSGLVAVLISAATYSTDLAFPGWIALLPTLGTIALLVSGAVPAGEKTAFGETASLLGRQPLHYVGDISYSLYLWHWPVIVLILEISGAAKLSKHHLLLAVPLSFALAVLSKHFIEDPFRLRRRAVRRRRGTYLLGAVLVALPVLVAVAPWQIARAHLDSLAKSSVLDDDHPGAMAIDPDHPLPAPSGVALVPDPAVAGHDFPLTDRPGCVAYDIVHDPVAGDACVYGKAGAPKTMVLVGDSHAAQFSSALAEFVRQDPTWRLKVMVRNGCPFNDIPPSEAGFPLTNCSDQNHAERDGLIALKPDLVIAASMSPESYAKDLNWTWNSRAQLVDGYRTLLSDLSGAGIPVAVIREVPRPAMPVPACLARNSTRHEACGTPRDAAFPPGGDPLVEAAKQLPEAKVVDLSDWICASDECEAVVGNVVVYRDNHLTDSYVRTLLEPLATQLGLH